MAFNLGAYVFILSHRFLAAKDLWNGLKEIPSTAVAGSGNLKMQTHKPGDRHSGQALHSAQNAPFGLTYSERSG